MADIQAIRVALAASLASIPDLRRSEYVLADPVVPCADIALGPTKYDKTMGRGIDQLTFTVRVFASATLNEAAQKRVDRFLDGSGPYSVKAAVEVDRTLGGACEDAHVTESTGHREYHADKGRAYLGAEWTVLVIASGD